MPDFVQRLQVLRGARFDFLFAVVASFGGSFITYLYSQPSVPAWVSGGAVLLWVIILFIIIFINAERRVADAEKDAARRETGDLEAQLRKEQRDTSINLLNAVVRNSSRSLRTVTECLRARARERARNDGLKLMTEDEAKVLQREMLRQIFHDLRAIFEGDTRGVDTTTYPHNFFKIALFQPAPSAVDAQSLVRTFWDYPEGVEPSPETGIVELGKYPRAAHVRAFGEQAIVILENVKAEERKPANERRWENIRANQASDYESMVCAAIVSGVQGHEDRRCLGVLVIDTDRERYFKEDRTFRAFVGNLLNPVRTILTLVLELDEYFIGSVPDGTSSVRDAS